MNSRKSQIMRESFQLEYDLPHPILDPVLVIGNVYKHDNGTTGIGIERVWLYDVDITRSVDLEEFERLVREDIQHG